MQILRLESFPGGWFVGDFEPTLFRNRDFEVAVKFFLRGDAEPEHYQRVATEITVVIDGRCRMGSCELSPGDLMVVEPGEAFDFEALTNVTIVALKFPSLPHDKIAASP